MAKLWETGASGSSGGESEKRGLSRQVEAFTVGKDYLLDRVLLPYDLEASAVHVSALRKGGLLTEEEEELLRNGLSEIRRLWEAGEFPILPEHEDGHTAIEVWLTGKLGELGKKIHTGRSRNDQVLTAVRLYERDQLRKTLEQAADCVLALLDQADLHREWVMPGYTHTRKGMLSSVAQWLGGYAELLIMQLEASAGIRRLVGRSPLGTAAGFGTTLDLDREFVSGQLGFEQPLVCATSAQLSRGWIELQLVDYLSGLTSLLARLAGDIIQFSSEAYGFIDIDPVFCTGSSIMPNKRNPDVAELIRGSQGEMAGFSATLREIISPLGSGYHRDLQLTKEPVIGAFEKAQELIRMSGLLVRGLSFNRQALEQACTSDLMAAEEAYRLVKEKGVTFRDAYRLVKEQLESGEAARRGIANPVELLGQYTQLGSPGNPGIERLKEQIGAFRSGL